MNVASPTSNYNPDAIMLRKLLLARSLGSRTTAPWLSYPLPVGSSASSSVFRPSPRALLLARQRSSFSSPSSNGLDLLRAVSLRVPNTVAHAESSLPTPAPVVSLSSSNPMGSSRIIASSRSATPTTSSEDGKYYVDKILDTDVLCGRGGKSNHHVGNKRYRMVVSEMKMTYRSTDAKKGKTGLSRAIVDHVCGYGRFLKKDESSGRYYVLSKAEARKKTSQALRETKTLKWTN